ncbi:VOC family protein [Candidatus Dependentiae bacterium]|nr:VOC family protein [Candidatus Dependentiae bacterium]
MAIKKIELAWIAVSDLKKAKKFFVDNLGLNLEVDSPEFNWMELQGKNGGTLLGIGKADEEYSPVRPGQNAVLTFTVDNIENTIKEMKSKGVEFIDEILEVPGQVKMITFKDFDGNMYQLVEHLSAHQHSEKCC